MLQQAAFNFIEENAVPSKKARIKLARAGTFADNMSLPIHRWFRYSAGFSAEWVAQVIRDHNINIDEYVFDPFVGSGTTLLASQSVGVNSAGVEHHHFVYKIAKAKLSWDVSEIELLKCSKKLLEKAQELMCVGSVPSTESELLKKCYITPVMGLTFCKTG